MFALTKDETGNRYGKLTVLALADTRKDGRVTWRCSCDCGGTKDVQGTRLRDGTVRSCGCVLSEVKRTLKPGDVFGRLTVVGYAERSKWRCECVCGSITVAHTSNLTRGASKSCGCYRDEMSTTHGMSRTREYKVWSGMIERCNNPKRSGYIHYGGRGIKVCERWMTFENFYSDVGAIPDGATLDRVNVNGDYAPGNVRFATWSQQRRNKRTNKEVVFQNATVAEIEVLLASKRGDGVFG